MAAPNTKQQLLNLVDTYIPATGTPNIRASEHRDLETKILDRVDARVLATGTITVPNLSGYRFIDIFFSTALYTSNYIVVLTPYFFTGNGTASIPKINSYKTTYTITNRTQLFFRVQFFGNTNLAFGVQGAYTGKFSYMVINKQPL